MAPPQPPQHPILSPILGSLTSALAWQTEAMTDEGVSEAVVEALAEVMAASGQFGTWLGYSADEERDNLFSRVVRRMVDQNSLGGVGSVTAKSLIQRYDDLYEEFGDYMEDIVRALGAALPKDTPIDDSLLMDLPRGLIDNVGDWCPGTVLGDLVARVDSALKGLSAAEWEEALGNGAHEVSTLIARIEKDALKLSAKDFMGGYQRSALNILSEAHGPQLTSDQWSKLYQAIPTNSRKVLARSILTDLVQQVSKPDGVAAFVSWYPDLAASLPLADFPGAGRKGAIAGTRPDRRPRRHEVHPRSFDGVQKCADGAQKKKEDEDASEAISVLEDAIDSLEQTENSNSADWAAELRLGLDMPRPVSEVQKADQVK